MKCVRICITSASVRLSSGSERSILPVDVVLRKQAGFKESPVYKKLEKDIREFLKRVK